MFHSKIIIYDGHFARLKTFTINHFPFKTQISCFIVVHPPPPTLKRQHDTNAAPGKERGHVASYADLVYARRKHRRERSGEESQRIPPSEHGDERGDGARM